MDIVFFEAETFEVEALSDEARARAAVEAGTLNALLDRHADVELAVIGVGSRVTEAELERLPRLRMVLARATGLDHIDAAACARRGVEVRGVPEYAGAAVAEFAVTLALYLMKGAQIRAGHVSAGFARELAGETVGVVGLGNIGRRVATAFAGLGADVLASNRREVEGFRVVPLPELLERSGVVSLHVAGEAGTILGDSEVRSMRADALLVNTARAVLVDGEALLEALQAGRIAGAALDVGPWETDRGWLERPDVLRLREGGRLVVTDHLAWATREARDRYMGVVEREILAWAR